MGKHLSGLHPGAVWRRVDFQVHTPRDHGWIGGPALPGGTPEAEARRTEWAREFVVACRDRGLGGVAITDHHDMCMVPYIQRAVRDTSLDGDLWVFPGMEVTCDDACQALLLFDSDTEANRWSRVYGDLPKVNEPNSAEAKAPQAEQCGKSLEDFLSSIAADSVLEPICIVLPHAGDEGSYKSVLRDKFNVRFRELQCDGFYTEKPFVELKPRTKRIVFGEQAEWGRRRRGLVPTGDNRSADFERLGHSPCWIRLGEPTAEAIRQALLVDEARITYDAPHLPSQRILSFRVSSSLTGLDLQVVLNDGFTAIIGGRGSGKSALLEYLRFGLGRSALDVETDSSEHSRARDLLISTLPGGGVEVELERDGVVEKWARGIEKSETISVELSNGEQETIDVSTAQERFRARAFEQKELSNMLPGPRSAVDQITSIAAAEVWDRRHSAEETVRVARREVRAEALRAVELWITRAQKQRADIRIGDVARRLESLGEQLEQQGLTPADTVVLGGATGFNRAESFLDEARVALEEASSEALAIEESLLPSLDLPEIPDSEEFAAIREFKAGADRTRVSIGGHLRSVTDELRSLAEARSAAEDSFSEPLARFREEYRAAAERQSALSQLVAEQERRQGELTEAEAASRRVGRKVDELSDAEDRLQQARQRLREAAVVRENILEEACNATEGMSGGLLRAEVRRAAVPGEYVTAIEQAATGAKIRDLRARAEERAAHLAEEGPDAWDGFCDRLLELRRRQVQLAGASEQLGPEEVASVLGNIFLADLTPAQLQQLGSRLDDERLVAVLTAVCDQYIWFDYKDRDGYISFESASPGQQAAALLQLLLSQEAGTLIIDQPEEDLDSGIIMEIVSLLRKTKQRRQLIFATHNPNFVVNGDADKVVALQPSGGSGEDGGDNVPRVHLWVDGALETDGVQDAVTRTIEGGREAFELRRRKYRFV